MSVTPHGKSLSPNLPRVSPIYLSLSIFRARQFPVKILAAIVLPISAEMVKYMTENVPGVFVPQHLIDELAAAPKGEERKKHRDGWQDDSYDQKGSYV